MKTRNGFVSNSSSSSFCIVGFNSGPEYDKLLTALGAPEDEEEMHEWMWDLDGWGGLYKLDDRLYATNDYDCFGIIGLDAEKFLKQNKRVSEIAQELADHIFMRYQIRIDPEKCYLDYGETSSE
jgi:hypothetical protein